MRPVLYSLLGVLALLGAASFALGQERERSLPPVEQLSPIERCALDGLRARRERLVARVREIQAQVAGEDAAIQSDTAAVVSAIVAAHAPPEPSPSPAPAVPAETQKALDELHEAIGELRALEIVREVLREARQKSERP